MPVQTLTTPPRRLRILGEEEIDALYGFPHFTDEARLEHFSLAPPEKAVLEQFHSIKSRISFILQLGYFKSHHLFFVFTLSEVAEDVRYIHDQYFPHVPLTRRIVCRRRKSPATRCASSETPGDHLAVGTRFLNTLGAIKATS